MPCEGMITCTHPLLPQDTTNPQEPFTCSLSQLSAVKQHAIEDTALQLSFDAPDKASGVRKISRSTARKIVLNFQCPASRAEFTGVLQAACKLAGAAPTLVHDWLEPVPSTAWARFCTNRWPVGSTVLSRPAPRVVLVNASRRLLNIVKQGAGEDDLVRGNAVVEQVIALAPGRLQLERSCSDETRVTVCVSGPEASIAGRAKGGPGITAVTFEFASHGDRERFCAHCALAIAEPEDAAEAAASLGAAAKLAVPAASSASEGGAAQGGHAETAGGKEQEVAATLHAYASAVSSLYGREWPQRTISVEVATFNAGGKPPSSDAAALGSWIPLPHTAVVKGVPSGGTSRRRTSLAHRGRSTSEVSAPTGTFDGTPDLVVIGLQEIGGQRNRDLWGAALLGHLNACAAGAAAGPVAGRATLTKHASAVEWGRPTPSALPAKAASLLDVTQGGSAPDDSSRTRRSFTATSRPAASSAVRGDGGVPAYCLVASEFMWELGIFAFVRSSCSSAITSVVSGSKATGMNLVAGQQLGNKGAVGIGFQWNGVALAFYNAHLAARPERIQQRNDDFTAIMAGLDLATHLRGAGLGTLATAEHVWFLGDLNYRVDLPFDAAHEASQVGDYQTLSRADQLLAEMEAGRVMAGFSEGPLDFPPTYRWERDSDFISYKRGQAPSYTDRVLHRSLPGLADRLSLLEYTSAHDYFGSDHRPVRALYELHVRTLHSAMPPLATHTLIPFPTFFRNRDMGNGPLPVVQVQNIRVEGWQALHAPGALFLSLYSPNLLHSHDEPVCSPAVPAQGVTAEQAAALVQLKQVLRKEEKERKAATKRAMKVQEAAEKSMHKAKAKALAQARNATRGETPRAAAVAAAARAPLPSPTAPVSDLAAANAYTDSETDSTTSSNMTGDSITVAPPAFGGARSSASMAMARANSVSHGDAERLALIALECAYDFSEGLTPVAPAVWDPRYMLEQHLVIAAHQATVLADGSVSDAADKAHPVLATAVVPLRPALEAAATSVAMSAMSGAGRSAAGLASRHRHSTVQVQTFAKTFDDNGVPLPLRGDAVPFAVPLVQNGVAVGVVTGQVALRSSNHPDLVGRVPGLESPPEHSWLGGSSFTDCLRSITGIMDGVQDAMLRGRQPMQLPALPEDGPQAEAPRPGPATVDSPRRRRPSAAAREHSSLSGDTGSLSASSRRSSTRASILAAHRTVRLPDGTVIPMSRLASTVALPPEAPLPPPLAVVGSVSGARSRGGSLARPASHHTPVRAVPLADTHGPAGRAALEPELGGGVAPRRSASVARPSFVAPRSVPASVVQLPADALCEVPEPAVPAVKEVTPDLEGDSDSTRTSSVASSGREGRRATVSSTGVKAALPSPVPPTAATKPSLKAAPPLHAKPALATSAPATPPGAVPGRTPVTHLPPPPRSQAESAPEAPPPTADESHPAPASLPAQAKAVRAGADAAAPEDGAARLPSGRRRRLAGKRILKKGEAPPVPQGLPPPPPPPFAK